jgi:hypothetical protein
MYFRSTGQTTELFAIDDLFWMAPLLVMLVSPPIDVRHSIEPWTLVVTTTASAAPTIDRRPKPAVTMGVVSVEIFIMSLLRLSMVGAQSRISS